MNIQARLPIRGRLPIKSDAFRASTHSAITLNSDFCTSNKDGVLEVAVGCLVHVLKIRPCDVLRAPPDKGAQDNDFLHFARAFVNLAHAHINQILQAPPLSSGNYQPMRLDVLSFCLEFWGCGTDDF
jgi:hypothetical protein